MEAQARDVNAGDILLLMFEAVRPGEKEQGKGQCLGASTGRKAEVQKLACGREGRSDHTPFSYNQMTAEVS